MRKMMIALVLALTLAPAAASAQSFEKKNYTYSEWTKGLFSEAVTVTLPGAKMIFLASFVYGGVPVVERRARAAEALARVGLARRSAFRPWIMMHTTDASVRSAPAVTTDRSVIAPSAAPPRSPGTRGRRRDTGSRRPNRASC